MASSKRSAAANAARAATSKTPSSVIDVDPVTAPVYNKGNQRPFLLSTPTTSKIRTLISQEYVLLGALLIISLYVRCQNLANPNSVVFDEVHFGGFARKYINGDFFMDVHPPLTKMLFAAVGGLAGFKGDFAFEKIGDVYPANENYYYYMRLFPAVLGVGTIILCYLTLRASGCRPLICLATAGLLAFENANVTISRYILLDSPLLFFIAAAVYSLKKFEIQEPFSIAWYRALLATGLSLGFALSSKWVGIFTVAWVGVSCLYQLWFIVGDLTVGPKRVMGHFIARGAFLLGVPLALYLAFFAIHFQILRNEGDGAAFMTPAFRQTLNGHPIPQNILANVGLGSVVSIRQKNTQSGYLHSHNSFYPTGSKQQQVTLYPHIDTNNNWIIESYEDSLNIPQEFVPLTDGMKIRLRHVNTQRRLHSHDEKPPVSERDWQKEVSCYGHKDFEGDANDDFILEVVKSDSEPNATDEVKAIATTFRLKHAMTGHYLFAGSQKLPDWGFDQQEVTCASQGLRSLTTWYIETNVNDRVNDTIKEIINYKTPTFLDKFIELNKRMWITNQGLTSHHNWQSSPQDWPLLLRGINYWVQNNKQIYFLGNGVTWWLSTFSIIFFIIYAIIKVLQWQTGSQVATDKNVFNFNVQCFLYIIGWLLHYAPFYIMGRQLFLHHYIPAAYFGILTLGHFFEVLVGYVGSNSKAIRSLMYMVIVGVFTASVVFYVIYSPLIYGSPWTKSQCLSSKLVSGWDFDCNNFHANLADYSVSSSASLPTDTVAPSNADNAAKETVFHNEPPAVEGDESSTEEIVIIEESSSEKIVPEFEIEGTAQDHQKHHQDQQDFVNDAENAKQQVLEDPPAPIKQKISVQAPAAVEEE